MPQFHIDEVYPKDTTYPLIVNFQNGCVSENFSTNDCALLENTKTNRKSVATQLCDLVYAGEEEDEDLSKTLLLARDKNTGKVRLIEVGAVELKPMLKANLEATELLETSNLELSRKFGSKKHKKIMEQREKLKLNVQTVTEQMVNVTDSITEEQLDLSSYNKTDADESYIPVMNKAASKVEDVYQLDDILTESQFEKISAELEHSDYTSDLNPFLKTISVKNLNKKHVVLFVYANTLLQLYRTLMKEIIKKNFTACPHSVTLNDVVIKNFLSNVNGKRGRSPQLKDKSLCHAIVFILLINNYKFDLDDLCTQLKLTPRTVTSKVAITGARIVPSGSKKLAQLKLPLNRPPMRRKSTKF